MFSFFAGIFGGLLNFLYNVIGNYGIAIIVFSVIVKLIILPMSLKQQKSMKQTNKMQEELNKIQDKYANDKERMSQEIMELYQKTGVNPFSGCFIVIIQFLLIISVFIMVKSPLTYVKKVDSNIIEKYETKLKEEKNNDERITYPEIAILKEFGKDNEEIYINMDFLGIDLSSIPTESEFSIKVWIIPVLYVVTAIASMKLTTNINNTGENASEAEKQAAQMSKNMTYIIPIMSISIAIIAPLGLALYWFMSNILSILERILIDRIQKDEEVA